MLDFNQIVNEVVRGTTEAGRKPAGISKTASRNHYEWTLANGLRSGDRVRLDDGREGALTAAFPGCKGDGEWCGVFLDDGSEENIRPDRVASVFDKSAGWKPLRDRKAADGDFAAPAADDVPMIDEGRSIRYVVEFQGHGTDHMSATMTKEANEPDGDDVASAGHDRSAKLLQALVEFESNTRSPTDDVTGLRH